MKLTQAERWILSNQFRILEKLYPNEAKHFTEGQEAIECGYELHYKDLSQHIYEETLSKDECKEVLDILTMFSGLKRAYAGMTDKSGIEERRVTFDGFDGNNETKQMAFARYFCEHDGGRFTELGNDFNSHSPRLGLYWAMLREWEKSAQKYELTKEDVVRIANAQRPKVIDVR